MEVTLKNKKFKIKYVVLLIILIIITLLSVSFIRWITSQDILDAAVDETNGNIAILNMDYEIKVYNTYGEMMFEMELSDNDGGYASLEYVNGMLNVQNIRTNILHVIDNDGQLIKKDVYEQEDENYAWDGGWKREKDAYRYQTDTVIYQYNYPTYFYSLFSKKEVKFEIFNQDTGSLVLLAK